MRLKIAVVVIIFCLIGSGCSKNEPINITLNSSEVQINSKVNSCRLIKSIDDTDIDDSMFEGNQLMYLKNEVVCSNIDTSKFGDQQLQIDYRKKTYKYLVKVVDTEGPVITTTKDEYTINQGDDFDLDSMITVVDNYDANPSYLVATDLDPFLVGLQNIRIIAWDSFENMSEKTITIIVKEVEVANAPDGTKQKNNKKSGGGSGGSGGGSSGGGSGSTKKPKITGVHDVTLKVGSSVSQLQNALSSGVGCNVACKITITYNNVNLSVPGTYTANYTSDVGASASCKVFIKE